ncbi:ATP-binding protein [Marinobacterium aestuariivivens]|uniref:histidine kinase n=1 Tax=Marinobacterium aestuariivivens TaxID=1698799 RepID=A0ABW2A601_9GAMM
MRSIRGFLMLMLVLLLGISTAVTVAWTYRHTSHEVEEVFDASLVQSAKVLRGLVVDHQQRQTLNALQRSVSLARLEGAPDEDRYDSGDPDDPGHPYEYQVGFQAGLLDGELLLSTPPEFPLRRPFRPGFETVGEGDSRWRIYTLRDSAHGLWIRSGHRMGVRDELTEQVADKVIIPLLVVLPLLLLMLSISIGRGLRPLVTIRHDLEQRRSDDLQPLPGRNLPSELQPVVASLNDLFVRVGETLERERRFTADAAHELRTPLAALRIHLEKLRLPETQTGDLLRGIDRMERVVAQLLMLARIEPQRGRLPCRPVVLEPLCCDLIAELYPRALERNLQIEFEGDEALEVPGDETLLGIMLRNLLENAIRYTREGDRLQLRLHSHEGQVTVEMVDHGPGLEADARQKVLDRFYRERKCSGDGAGLGLSIVSLIVELHQGRLSLDETPGGGLTVRIHLPAASDA